MMSTQQAEVTAATTSTGKVLNGGSKPAGDIPTGDPKGAGGDAAEDLQGFVARVRPGVEEALREALPASSLAGARRLNEALYYAVFPGGKRLRPALALLAADLAGASRAQGMRVACAVEFLHSSSLILDDLPAMDDASRRRGRRALHLVYGEGVAVLAAVALLNQSYALLAQAGGASGSLVAEAARCVGADGMAGGQAVDLEARAGRADNVALICRDLKTIALMRLMMTGGALACGAAREETRALADFGDLFGHAYQVCDDLLDEAGASRAEGANAATGKPAGQDARHARATYVSAFGVGGAARLAADFVERGVARLRARFGARGEVLLLAEAAASVLARANAGGAHVAGR